MTEAAALSMTPLAGESPEGVNLEYDALYLQLDELANGAPAKEMGDSVLEGREPDFRTLRRSCLKLWESTRDLRVACYFALAALRLDGYAGFAGALKVIAYLIDEQYEHFYPMLDPDDDNDPTERINILQLLSPPPVSLSDSVNCIALLRQVPLCEGFAYSYRDYLVLNGTFEAAPGSQLPEMPVFQAELARLDTVKLRAQLSALQEAAELTEHITEAFNAKAGEQGYLTMDTLGRELRGLMNFFRGVLADRGADTAESAAEEAPAAETAEAGAAAAAAAPSAAAPVRRLDVSAVTISNRAEALLLLQRCADYFAKTEPSSPLPFLIKRALRMADMNFIELLGEIDSSAQERGKEQLGYRDDPEE